MRILVVNAGSSSLKLRLLDEPDALLFSSDLPAMGEASAGAALAEAISGMGRIDAAGHRLVHGGSRYSAPVEVDDGVEAGLQSLQDLAPSHLPQGLKALRAVRQILPGVASVACFDTAFHAGLPEAAATYAIPASWRSRWGLRRYGFHGLSHAYASERAAELLSRPPEGFRVITAHLGAGASLAAVKDGRSVDTTMGFTPLEGLVMATRSGSVDPGMILWLEQHGGLSAAEVSQGLEHGSGLAGLAGTSDMAQVLALAESGEPGAVLALQVYLHRLRQGIAGMAAAMGGADALAFTGGVGENSPAIRAMAVQGLSFLGTVVDDERNQLGTGDREIGPPGSAAATLVIHAREDLQIARQVRRVLASRQ